MTRWTELDAYEGPWVDVFVLMWEAYTAGTIPVGAVITDESGRIVARGRNRMFGSAEGAELGESRLAHAEVNALLGLPSDRTYEAWTLWTALEPCHLCLSAAFTARIGRLSYACSDAYGGAAGKLVPSRDHEAHPVRIDGPLDGVPGVLPELLLIAHCLWRRPEGDVVRFYTERWPGLVDAARGLPAPDAGASLTEVYAAVRARGLEPPRSVSPTGT